MSRTDSFINQTFASFSFASESADSTKNLITSFVKILPTLPNELMICIMGGVHDGKTQIANALRAALMNQDNPPRAVSKLSARANPAWQAWTDNNKEIMLRNIDMAAIDQFNDAVIPSLKTKTYDIIEHATPAQQEKAIIVIEIQKDSKDSDTRLINIYINPTYMPADKVARLRFRP